MALDNVEVMAELGFKKFMAAGHDRGGRVLHRMCLDHPDKVERAAILDIIPQHHLLNNVTRQWGQFSWHWFFNIQPAPLPEKMMGADPDWFIQKKLAKTRRAWNFSARRRSPNTCAASAIRKPIHAICEDYRATFGVDLEMDTKDFAAGRKIGTPLLLLWGATGGVGRNHKPAQVWADMPATSAAPRRCRAGITCPKRRRRKPTRSFGRFFWRNSSTLATRASPTWIDSEFVMAGLVPAIHALPGNEERRGCPAQEPALGPAEGRTRGPGMTGRV